jgi:hypothetical protein
MLLITVQSKTKQWIVERKQLTLFSRDSFLCLSDNTCCINEIYFSLWSETHPSNSKDENLTFSRSLFGTTISGA